MCSPDIKMVLIDDFNVDLLDPSHFLFNGLADLKDGYNLNQHVTQPTWFDHGKPSLLDHIYTNENTSMGELQYLSPIGRCHHASLQFSVDFNSNPVQKFCRTVWKCSNADWEKTNDCLSSFQLDQNQDVDCAWKCFHDMFMQTMSECIPQKLSSCKAVTPPWLTAELRK